MSGSGGQKGVWGTCVSAGVERTATVNLQPWAPVLKRHPGEKSETEKGILLISQE